MVVLSDRAIESLIDAPPNVRRAFEKQLRFLVDNLQHPSLRAKKYDESKNLWQARVNRDWRFYFTITADTYCIEDVIAHPKQEPLHSRWRAWHWKTDREETQL